MVSFLSRYTNYKGKLNSLLLSLFYRGISGKSNIIRSVLFDKSKIFIGDGTLLYSCRLRVSRNSKYIKIGNDTRIENNAFINAHSGYVEIGSNCFIGPNTVIQGYGGVNIKDKVLIAGNCFISSSNHVYDGVSETRFLLDETGANTIINRNTWIGSNVTVVAGIEIGEGCVIGAGSVVTKNIPSFSVAVGIPARVIKSTKYASE